LWLPWLRLLRSEARSLCRAACCVLSTVSDGFLRAANAASASRSAECDDHQQLLQFESDERRKRPVWPLDKPPFSPIVTPLMKRNIFCCLSAAVAAIVLSGCASYGVRNPSGVPVTEMRADERGFVAGTGIESQDIVTVADKMAREILATPEI